MFAIFYLVIMLALGDSLSRRFYHFVSWPHRIAASFFVGLIVSSWFTYLSTLLWAHAAKPLLWGNLLFFASAVALIYWLNWRAPRATAGEANPLEGASGVDKWDWICFGAFLLFACWLMFATLSFRDGQFLIGIKSWTDFGANISLLQSFVLGNNFPTTHPFFPGEPIRYHFLFWFQTANLSFLGLNPVWSVNLLSILSLLALFTLIMTFAKLLFNSRVVGRLAALLFLFSSSLYYLPFLQSQAGLRGTVNSILDRTEFLPSGYPGRGENWGVLTISVLGYQRHLISGIGILLLVMVFLVDRYRAKLKEASNTVSPEENERPSAKIDGQAPTNVEAPIEKQIADDDGAPKSDVAIEGGVIPGTAGDAATGDERTRTKQTRTEIDRPLLYASVFSGVLIGLLPFWNSAVFVASLAVLGCLFVLFPYRIYLGSLIVTTLLLGIPQVLMLRTRTLDQPLFHWGYTLDNPTLFQGLKYLGWSFGFKWLLILVALVFLKSAHRKFFLAVSSLIAVVFLFQLSVDNFNNHKLLNVWAIFASVYAAFGLWRIAKIGRAGVALASILAVATVFGGIVDLFPIHNDPMLTVPHGNDRLTTWLLENTKPSDVFLSQTLLTHPILFTGRKVFLGNTLFAWSAGYRVGEREAIYHRMFEIRDPTALIRLLYENNIAYVAIDNGLRHGGVIKNLNEAVYERTCEKVFQDNQNQYDALSIYKVPVGGTQDLRLQQATPHADFTSRAANAPAVTAFVGGRGNGLGQFEHPRGIAVDAAGNIYVADTGNARIEKFSSQGEFLAFVGKSGTGEGELREPNGIAIDPHGNIYVTDATNHRLIKFKGDGTFQKQWIGPGPGFFGPRDVAIGPLGELYVVDQGRSRIVKFSASGEVSAEWGGRGNGDGDFFEPTAIAVAGEKVYVADAQNGRIQVFDTNGKFLNKWDLVEWQKSIWQYPDLIVDQASRHLYASSTTTDEVLVFNLAGRMLARLSPAPPEKFEGPSGLALAKDQSIYVLNFHGVRVSRIDRRGHPHGRSAPAR